MTDQKNGPWRVHDTQTAFENPWLRIEASQITHPDGSPGTYGVVRYANIACGVMPIDEEGCTWLVGQHRFPFDAYSWELPEGGGAKSEAPQRATARELHEETGIVAKHYIELGRWHLSNSVSDEVAIGYLAWGLEHKEAMPEPSEALQVQRVALAELLARIRAGEITDAFSHLMVMRALDMARQGDLPEPIATHLRNA